MHPVIFAAFQRLCAARIPPGGRVLEIGAMSDAQTLLYLPALAQAALRVGTNREKTPPLDRVSMVQVGVDSLACFADSTFDAVLCNSALEHDPMFWCTLQEIRRVARPGAVVIIGVPGYCETPPPWPLRWRAVRAMLDWVNPAWLASTPTLLVHNFPGDYYRFSPQAVREVLLAGCGDVEVSTVLRPPRIIGFGRCAKAS